MNQYFVAAIFAGMAVLAGAAFVWQAAVASQDPSPAQKDLLNAADWLLKCSGGALVGFLLRGQTNSKAALPS